MLSKYFSYYNYKITQNIDIPILFFKKKCAGTIRPAHSSNMQFRFFPILQWSLPPCRLRGQLQILGNQQRSRPDVPQMQRLHGRMRQQR